MNEIQELKQRLASLEKRTEELEALNNVQELLLDNVWRQLIKARQLNPIAISTMFADLDARNFPNQTEADRKCIGLAADRWYIDATEFMAVLPNEQG